MEEPRTRVLFVDDDTLILELIRLTVGSMKGEWDTGFATSAEEALGLIEHEPFDVVVSDMRLPGMNGTQLLNVVMRQYPGTVRIILSGHGDQEEVLRCVGATHQFLLKPFKLPELQAALNRIKGLKARLASAEIQRLVAKREHLPSIPKVYFEILDALQNPECSSEELGNIVSTDPALTSKLLQLVNSAFMGFAREVASAEEAVMLLGTGTIRSLALGLHAFSAFKSSPRTEATLQRVWEHSARVARFAERITRLEGGDEKMAEESFTAGLLHDIGKLLLVDNQSAAYLEILARAGAQGEGLIHAERIALNATHAEIGAYLLDLWGLPLPLVEAVAYHHEPGGAGHFEPGALTFVHAADVLEHEAATPPRAGGPLDLDYLAQLGLESRIDEWRQQLAEL